MSRKQLTGKQLLWKLAWLPVVAANTVASYLTLTYVQTQFRTADSDIVGNALGIEALVLWVLVEGVIVLGLAAWEVTKRERKPE